MMKEYHRIRRSGSPDAPRQYEAELIDRYGNIKNVLVTVAMIPATRKSVLSFLDITERKHAEAALRESEKQLRRITDNMLDMVCQTDTRGIIQYASPSNESVVGYKPEDLLGKPVFTLVHPDDLDRVITAFLSFQTAINASSRGKIEFRFKHADGHYFWVETVGKPLFDDMGMVVGAIFGGRDITERKHAEAALRQMAAELQAVFRALPDLYFRLGADGTFLDVQAGRLCDLYLPIEDLLGKRIQDTSRRLAGQFQQAIDQTLQRRSLVMIEYALTIGGEKKFFEARFLPLLEDQVIEVVRNITGRKRDEEELQQYRERLEVLVEQRTAELGVINKELESFSYSVSHDLRSPLRIIDGYSQVLEEDYLEKLGIEGMKNIQIIRSQCQRMGELINDILDLSRLSRKEMQVEEVSLSQLAESIAAELQRREPERQVDFIITPNLEVRGDKQLLQSLLENLINNAWKFTGKHPRAKIELGVKKNGNKQAYFVRDDGAGFDMKYAEKLFGAFQRLHTVKEFPGTGVGLAIVQRIVHRHGGQVWAEGAEEKGATFYFTLNRQISRRDKHG